MEFLGNSFYIFDASYITYAKLKGEKKMEEKKTGAIKIDWFNLKAHFSPNVNLISKKIQSSVDAEDIKESIIWFEILSDKIEKSECKTYSLENDEIIDTEPNNRSNPWYFDFCGETSLFDDKTKTPSETAPKIDKNADTKSSPLLEALTKPTPETSPAAQPKIPTQKKSSSLIEAFKKPATKPSPPPKLQAPAQKSQSIPPPNIGTLKKTIPESPSDSEISTEKFPITTEEQVKHLEDQLDSTRNIILSLDKRFSAGLFNLEEYLEKKDFLIRKIENFKSQIEKLKK